MAKPARYTAWLVVVSVCVGHAAGAQQVAEVDFRPSMGKAAFAADKGPLVLIDEAHSNFHTASGRYLPFANLLRRDGYVVKPSTAKFSRAALRGARIVVIANAIGERNRENWEPPIDAAFADDEVKALHEWVMEGGALLFIVDHTPFPQANNALAAAFGVHFEFGVALSGPRPDRGPDLFTRQDGALADHAITRGRGAGERVDSIATFTGCSFKIDHGDALLTFVKPEAFAVMPKAGLSPEQLPHVPIRGWLQGAVFTAGKGKVAMFGEAAMFSAQRSGPDKQPMGMNAPMARQNAQFVLNVLHWLSGLL